MKIKISILLFVLALAGCGYHTGKVLVTFDSKLNKHDLDSIKDTLEVKNIQLKYGKLVFDSTSSKLTYIKFNVECMMGSKLGGSFLTGSAETVINDTTATGFSLDFNRQEIIVGDPNKKRKKNK